tara:strand:- start:1021 stop:1242 length:222 start_codon:yes stop_codon:yes gene_type:complete
LLLTVFHTNHTSSLAVVTVVVGKAIVLASKLAPQVIALAAVQVIAIHNLSFSTGVQVRFVVKLVISTVCAVSE